MNSPLKLSNLNWMWGLVALSWGSLVLTGHHHAVNHAHLMSHSSTDLSAIARSFAAWETMTVAMMLPSTLPIAQKFVQINHVQPHRLQHQLAFLSAYLALWSGVAISASCLEVGINHLYPHLTHHPLFQPLMLLGVGVFQFTPTKQTCLSGCRSASAFIAQYYDRGIAASWMLGWQHGLFCLGCCWALMLGCTALGMNNLIDMLIFTAIMTVERLWKYGEQFAGWVGLIAIAWGTGLLIF